MDADLLLDEMRKAWAPPPRLTLSQWANQHAVLSAESSAEVGRWKTIPYQRGLMDAITDRHVEKVTVMKSARVGWTKIINHALGYHMHHDPCPIMVVQPTIGDAEGYSKDEVAPMLRDTPCLEGLVAETGRRDSGNTILHKALAIDTPIPTPDGWKAMGDIIPGDTVFDENGQPCRVTYVTPIMSGRPCYRVVFSDGATIVADDEHPWQVEFWRLSKIGGKAKQVRQSKIVTTREIRDALAAGKRPFAVPVTKPLQLGKQELPVDPYILGAWLGDGYSHRTSIVVSCEDAEIADHLSAAGASVSCKVLRTDGQGLLEIRLDPPRDEGRSARGCFQKRDASTIRAGLESLGIITARGGNGTLKSIPPQYLRASFEQRLALLQGLMDTDGHARPKGDLCVFVTSIPELADDVGELLYSLGIKFSRKVAETYRKPAIRLEFTAPPSLPVFRLSRKLERQTDRKPLTTKATCRRILAVEPVDSVPVRCISVDSASHLYLAGLAMIPTHNTFPGGQLRMVGADSPRGFRRVSIRFIAFDEVDGYAPTAGEEGDQIKLGVKRTEYFWNRKILAGSTPTLDATSRIQRLFEKGDQRRYFVPCPECRTFQVLKWENMRWEKGRPETVLYHCIGCGAGIEYRWQRWMIEEADRQALAGNPDAGWVATNPNAEPGHASFHIWAAYSWSPNATWEKLAREWMDSHKNVEERKTFINTVLGETYKGEGDAPDWKKLYDRRETYRMGRVPSGGLVLFAGVDVQADRIEVEIVAYGRRMQSWSVDYRVFKGDTADHEGPNSPFRQLDELLDEWFDHDLGGRLQVRMLAIDTGFRTHTVYQWVRGKAANRVVAVDGRGESYRLMVGQPKAVEINPTGKKKIGSVKLWPIGTSLVKTEIYGWLKQEKPTRESGLDLPHGYCHFPEYPEEYFRGLTAEEVVPRLVKGFRRYQWEKVYDRNEPLDCRVYARAASALLGIDRWQDRKWDELQEAVSVRQAEKPATPAKVVVTRPKITKADDPYL